MQPLDISPPRLKELTSKYGSHERPNPTRKTACKKTSVQPSANSYDRVISVSSISRFTRPTRRPMWVSLSKTPL
jgi:hypothetical protein